MNQIHSKLFFQIKFKLWAHVELYLHAISMIFCIDAGWVTRFSSYLLYNHGNVHKMMHMFSTDKHDKS